MKVGIDAISFYIPTSYLPIEDLANARSIEPEKLKAGLGLQKMAIPLAGEDAATMAAEALWDLLRKENLSPKDISRIYLGTESALDGAKPTMSYAIEMVENLGNDIWGAKSFVNCDVVDMTFACIGATDALQNCLDYVRLHPVEKVIVIASDIAKYDLNSSGEYTQGAGAVAVLISANPRITSYNSEWGVGMQSVHDFFKPKRKIEKEAIIQSMLGQHEDSNPCLFGVDETYFDFTKESPMFDGQYSNQCFSDRMTEAYAHFCTKNKLSNLSFENWDAIIFHLPYAFHGKRVFVDLYVKTCIENGEIQKLEEAIGEPYDMAHEKDFIKKFAKSSLYKSILQNKLEDSTKASSEIGNMYTASIFMALISHLNQQALNHQEIQGQTLGFIAYGSGSKSKVFTSIVENGWKEGILSVELNPRLEERKSLTFNEYLSIHKKEKSALKKEKGFVLDYIEEEKENYIGARFYKHIA